MGVELTRCGPLVIPVQDVGTDAILVPAQADVTALLHRALRPLQVNQLTGFVSVVEIAAGLPSVVGVDVMDAPGTRLLGLDGHRPGGLVAAVASLVCVLVGEAGIRSPHPGRVLELRGSR